MFDVHGIYYIPSVSVNARNKIVGTLRSLITYLFLLFRHNSLVYIHSASHRSFTRKALFLLPAVLMRRTVLFHIHPDLFIDFLQDLSGISRICFFPLLQRVSGFVVLSEGMRKEMHSLFPGIPVQVLRNPVDLNSMKNTGGYGRKNGQILFLGWFVAEKGVYELVDAIGLLVERGYVVHLDFYGTKEIDRLREYVSKKGLVNSVIVHGWIEHAEKVRVLHESTILVLPSHTEGVPNVILEAMATRTPIVSTHVGGLREVLCDGENALIAKVMDSVDLSEKIAMLLEDPVLRERLADNAFQEVKDKYNVLIIKQEFASMLQDICHQSDEARWVKG
jgi:glycosyltransferase involved in cell wall biosynthesis